jgi:hypothetical protein
VGLERGGGMTHLYIFIIEEMIVDSMESSRKKDRFKESLKGLSHEIDFKNFDQTLKNLT